MYVAGPGLRGDRFEKFFLDFFWALVFLGDFGGFLLGFFGDPNPSVAVISLSVSIDSHLSRRTIQQL